MVDLFRLNELPGPNSTRKISSAAQKRGATSSSKIGIAKIGIVPRDEAKHWACQGFNHLRLLR
jgi:hypothetical protein